MFSCRVSRNPCGTLRVKVSFATRLRWMRRLCGGKTSLLRRLGNSPCSFLVSVGLVLIIFEIRIAQHAEMVKQAERIKDSGERQNKLEELRSMDCPSVCNLEAPVGWPIIDEDLSTEGREVVEKSGLPRLGLIMQVDIMGKFKFERAQAFQGAFGDLPARATFELTSMLYKTTTLTSASESLPKSIFMAEPELLSEYDRKQRFLPSENTMDGFCTAGYYSKQYINVMNVVRSVKGHGSGGTKVDLYNEYMERAQNQFKSLVLNGNLHSNHTLFAAQYIDRVEASVCGDLRALIAEVFKDEELNVISSDDMEDQTFSDDVLQRTHWSVMCPSSFVAFNWTFEEMRR